MVSFVNYILKFVKEDSARGDVAREMKDDTGINKRWGYKTFKKYLSHKNLHPNILPILLELKSSFDVEENGRI